jgi:hypothetical protein
MIQPRAVRTGDHEWAAQIDAGVEKPASGLGLACVVEQPLIGVQSKMARIEITLPMKVLAARFRHRQQHDWTFSVLGAEFDCKTLNS